MIRIDNISKSSSHRILYIEAALIYLALSSVLSTLQVRLERRFARYGGYLEARA